MASLKQYTDLFRQERVALDANAPEALNAGRDRAMAFLEAAGRLPEKIRRGV